MAKKKKREEVTKKSKIKMADTFAVNGCGNCCSCSSDKADSDSPDKLAYKDYVRRCKKGGHTPLEFAMWISLGRRPYVQHGTKRDGRPSLWLL